MKRLIQDGKRPCCTWKEEEKSITYSHFVQVDGGSLMDHIFFDWPRIMIRDSELTSESPCVFPLADIDLIDLAAMDFFKSLHLYNQSSEEPVFRSYVAICNLGTVHMQTLYRDAGTYALVIRASSFFSRNV